LSDTFADDPAASHVSSRPVNCYVASEAAFERAVAWLVECHSDHSSCRRYTSNFLPNRVIDVSIPNESHIVRLVSTAPNELENPAKYIALSYCWGIDQPIKTTKSTLFQHMSNISVSVLPETLQHAILVTRRLGIRYLWVDSLCIIQDDPEDISKEVSLMPEYYENSFVTICAASANNCTQGFLQPRPQVPYAAGPFKLRHSCPNNEFGSVQLVQYSNFTTEEEVINSRGWTLQESLLSTRLLTYGSRNLRWSCREAEFSDGGPWEARYDLGLRQQWGNLKHEERYRNFESRGEDLATGWRNIVEDYTRRTISVSGDKLPALSGIARRYQESLSGRRGNPPVTYLAGLWSVDIIRQLYWNTEPYLDSDVNHAISRLERMGFGKRPKKKQRRVCQHRAPSWSWASIDGIVSHGDWDSIPSEADWIRRRLESWCHRAKIVNIELKPEMPAAPFGALKSGTLSIEGRVIPARREWTLTHHFDLSLDTEEDRHQLDYALKEDRLKLLQLTSVEVVKYAFHKRPRGLILVKSDTCRDKYHRIGTFRRKSRGDSNGRGTNSNFDGVDPQVIKIF
jgi:hypothetical protein